MGESTYRLIGFCVFNLSFLLGFSLIILFWNNRTIRFGSFCVIKSFGIIHFGFYLFLPWLYDNFNLQWRSTSIVVEVILFSIFEVILSGTLTYIFRDLFLNKSKMPRLLLLSDFLHWTMFVAINYLMYDSDPFSTFPFSLIWICAYPIFMLSFGIIQNRRHNRDKPQYKN